MTSRRSVESRPARSVIDPRGGRPTRRLLVVLGVIVALMVAPVLVLDCGHPEPLGNLAADADISTTNTIGPTRQVVRSAMSAPGSTRPPDQRLLVGREGAVQLDFGEPIGIAALLLHAEFDDRYAVDASLDAVNWTPVWTAPAIDGWGLQTRHEILPEPVQARYLRIRNEEKRYGTTSYINAIRVYSDIPEGWPHHEAASSAASSRSFPWLDLDQIHVLKFTLTCVGALVFALCLLSDRIGFESRHKERLKHLLVGVTIVASLGWWNFLQLNDAEFNGAHRNYWDVLHYYFGSKYSSELQYTNLYHCLIAADLEDGLRVVHARRPLTRDLESNEFVGTVRVFAEANRCTERFSPDRWVDFKHDQAWFRGHFLPAYWQVVPLDHGYNASPAWTVVGRALGNLGRISDLGFILLISIDTILLAIMWYVVWSTFGWLATCGALIFWSTNLVAWNHFVMGSLLRHDWLFSAVVGVCCLKRGRMTLAGFLLAHAALLRIFPVFLIGGVALGALVEMFQRRSLVPSRPRIGFALGVIAAVVVVGGLSLATSDRTTEWSEFIRNTSKHGRTAQVQNIGLRALVMHIDQPELRALETIPIEDLVASYDRPIRALAAGALALLFLPVLALAASREDDWVAAILGLMWLPFVRDVNNYYWAFLLLFALLTVRKRELGLAFAAIMVLFGVLGLAHRYSSVAMFTWSSLAVVLYFSGVALAFALPKLGELRKTRAQVPVASADP